jgi:hypothetical protein
MRTIELALDDASYAQALQNLLAKDAAFQDCVVRPSSEPEPESDDPAVLVLDGAHLEHLSHPLAHPERVVLIAKNAPEQLTRAWEAGIVSVVFDHDPLSMAMLAILAARYRACKP